MGAFCGKIRLVYGPHTLQYAPARTIALRCLAPCRADEPQQVVVWVDVDYLPAVGSVIWIAGAVGSGRTQRTLDPVGVVHLDVGGRRGRRGIVVVVDEQVQLRGTQPHPRPPGLRRVGHDVEAELLIVSQRRLDVPDGKAGCETGGLDPGGQSIVGDHDPSLTAATAQGALPFMILKDFPEESWKILQDHGWLGGRLALGLSAGRGGRPYYRA